MKWIPLVLLAGCIADEYAPEVGPPLTGACDNADSDPDTDVSFSHDLRPLLAREAGMAGCSCHTPTNGAPSGITLGGLDLGSYESLRAGGFNTGDEIVVPGEPCRSRIVEKLSLPSWGARMPLDGPPYFTDEEVQLVADWIAEGADDD